MISKTEFQRGRSCSRYLYLKQNNNDLAEPRIGSAKSPANSWQQVENLAYQLYHGGVNVFDKSKSLRELAEDTIKAMEGDASIIYQPTFISADGNYYFRGDLLVKAQRRWKLIEVKSSTHIKLPDHIFDVGFQYMILKSLNLHKKIDVHLAYINKNYILKGELNLSEYFIEENITHRAKEIQVLIKKTLVQFEKANQRKYQPQVDLGKKCFDKEKCIFYNHCWKGIPELNVYSIGRVLNSQLNYFKELGITRLDEIPSDARLSDSQWLEVNAALDGEERINKSRIKEFISRLGKGPLIFMDFESSMPAIPQFKNSRPYQQICYQYCVIIQDSIGKNEYTRKEFIAEPGYDPRASFVKSLLEDTVTPGKIIVYNKAFEVTRLRELANQFPLFKDEIEERISRIVDLMEPFEKKYYYHPSFKGSFSIKVVAPALSPEISYKNLNIQNGSIAMQVLEGMHLLSFEEQIIAKRDLLEYCFTDVLSMVHILKNLNNLIKKEAA